ncbi:MAG: phosphocholine cytidylyltransferase family protein [Chloroflexi bacterium]|nr:phosphocholine cytidylyltransferase family protein [Chloroflexota bacterium]
MKVILIGAGRGNRLMPLTASQPKCLTIIAEKSILEWTLDAFHENGLDRFVFIGGYLKATVQESYPELHMVENPNWPDNNILFSLLCAREHFLDGFYSTYTDTLFRGNAVRMLKESSHDIVLVMDTRWRERYKHRSQHPERDGEKIIASGDLVTRISRDIPSERASGEFTGLMKMSPDGAARFLEFYDGLFASMGSEGMFHDGKPFRMAYLIHQLDRMIRAGTEVHCVAVPGDYHEIDTIEDYRLATEDWTRFLEG